MSGFSRLAAIVLAAGLSSRMGGENKLLKALDSKPLLAHCLHTVASLGLGDAVVVTGRGRTDVGRLAAAAGLREVHNQDYKIGMATSIRAGVSALAPTVEAAFIVLGDMPFVAADDYKLLADAWHSQPQPGICRPVYDGKGGHPVLFARGFFAELQQLTGDEGAAPVLQRHASRTMLVPVASSRVVTDFDKLDDFCRKASA